jgi:hypothetical protein
MKNMYYDHVYFLYKMEKTRCYVASDQSRTTACHSYQCVQSAVINAPITNCKTMEK